MEAGVVRQPVPLRGEMNEQSSRAEIWEEVEAAGRTELERAISSTNAISEQIRARAVERKVKRICAWCKADMGWATWIGPLPPMIEPLVTHGICQGCAERLLQLSRGVRNEVCDLLEEN